MEVNKHNWETVFPLFLSAVQDPSLAFMSFDFEMTGISLENEPFDSQNRWTHTPEERYSKMVGM